MSSRPRQPYITWARCSRTPPGCGSRPRPAGTWECSPDARRGRRPGPTWTTSWRGTTRCETSRAASGSVRRQLAQLGNDRVLGVPVLLLRPAPASAVEHEGAAVGQVVLKRLDA